jgi:hypothetical protein
MVQASSFALPPSDLLAIATPLRIALFLIPNNQPTTLSTTGDYYLGGVSVFGLVSGSSCVQPGFLNSSQAR